jgi:hypothetical protein
LDRDNAAGVDAPVLDIPGSRGGGPENKAGDNVLPLGGPAGAGDLYPNVGIHCGLQKIIV